MENIRVAELQNNNVIRFQESNKDFSVTHKALVQQVYSKELLGQTKWFARVVTEGNQEYVINDNWDFVRVAEPFNRKISIENNATKDNVPIHYQGSGDIDVIEFLYQQLPLEQFKGFMIGNMIKYPVRSNRTG